METGAGAKRTAFLLLGYKLTPRFLKQIEDARANLTGRADVHVLGYFQDPGRAPVPFREDPTFHAFGPDRMLAFGYPRKTAEPFRIMPGNLDLLLLAFLADHPDYDRLWYWENDVAFTGRPSELLDAFERSPADLLATNMRRPRPDWPHLPGMLVPSGWPDPLVTPLRAFLPAARVSRRFLEEMADFYRAGGTGHHEATWPYVAHAQGLLLEDIGGSGPFVAKGNHNRFYTSTPWARMLYPGTFRYRPLHRRPGRRPLTLYHPVKYKRERRLRFITRRLRLLWTLPRDWLRRPRT